jgi:hypothetical protein
METACGAFITALKIVREPEASFKFRNEFARLRTLDGSATPGLAELAAANAYVKEGAALPCRRTDCLTLNHSMEGTSNEP